MSLDRSISRLINTFGLDQVRAAVDRASLFVSGVELRRRRQAVGLSSVALAARVADATGAPAGSIRVAISRWEGLEVVPSCAAEVLAALDAAEAAPSATADEGAALLARWRDLDIPVARWGERAAVDACVAPRSAVAAIYAWAAGRGAPAAPLRAALIAVLEAAEASTPVGGVGPVVGYVDPPLRPAPAPPSGGMTLDDLIGPRPASTDTGSGVGKGAGSGPGVG